MSDDYKKAERILTGLPVGSIVKLPASVGFGASFWQRQVSGVVRITPGAYCRAISGAE